VSEESKPSDSSKSEQEHKHILRTPSAFGKRTKSFDEASGFVTVQGGYWGKIADGATKILRAKYASGELKKPSVSRGKVSKVSILIIILAVSFASAIVYAQFQGKFTATTTMRSPLTVRLTQFQLPDLWMNTTSSTIIDNAFLINTGGRSITYSFRVWAETTVNGTTTQDMVPLFTQFQIAFSDYSRNVTVASLLSPAQTVSFIYSCTGDVQFRLILSYSSKSVQLGTNSTPLTVFFVYAYSE
jgi:hypothetical protein